MNNRLMNRRGKANDWVRASSDVESKITKLEKLTSTLPRVNEDGSSECEFADDMYKKKEIAENELTEALSRLKGCLAKMQIEVERCRRNIQNISNDASKLNLPEVAGQIQTLQSTSHRLYLDLHFR